MRNILLGLGLLALTLTGCKSLSKGPLLDLSSNKPYQLRISDFDWGYGTTEINKFNGDFEGLDKDVFNLLKDKEGTCSVYLEEKNKDKYGATNISSKYIGVIELSELNKFQEWEYWHKDGGIKHLIYTRIVNPPSADSVRVDKVTTLDSASKITETPSTNAPQPYVQPNNSNDYTFGLDDLYSTGIQPSTLSENRFIINGSITEVYFDLDAFLVTTVNGSQVLLKFYPTHITNPVLAQLQLALKPGYSIRCMGMRTDSTTYDLLAAKIKIE